MNYGEELGYWYLRLNGFFPVSNFVVHRTEGVEYRSDVDVLAVRTPYIFEDVGGQHHDWDPFLVEQLEFGKQIGLVCEVKTGQFARADLFPSNSMRTSVGRLGLVPVNRIDELGNALSSAALIRPTESVVLAKLLISPHELNNANFLSRTVGQVEDFILNRVRDYSDEKFASRMFFPSPMFQLLIAQVRRERDAGRN